MTEKKLDQICQKDVEQFLVKVRQNIIGDDEIIETPYGKRKLTYMDYVASGRNNKLVEDVMEKEVYPFYSNTHTVVSECALRTGRLREEAREQVLKFCGGNPDLDDVIFVGNGATGASNVIVDMLFETQKIKNAKHVVVFNTLYEHHSNILPYREKGCEVIIVPPGKDNTFDYDFLETQLKNYQEHPDVAVIGAISACSNVTGVLTDTSKICSILKKYGAFAIFDYAAGGPYLKIDMENKDALFFSMHKFVGGPQCSGVCVLKKKIFAGLKPHVTGGGTVKFVTRKNHTYVGKVHDILEAGTPNVLGCIRCGLAYSLKRKIKEENIKIKEEFLIEKVINGLKDEKNLIILGKHIPNDQKLAFLSFVMEYNNPDNYHNDTDSNNIMYIHPNFLSKLMNDLFGIQSRSGCMCAGPYVQSLLNYVNNVDSVEECIVKLGVGAVKPGVCRVAFHYSVSNETVEFVIKALKFLCKNAWKFLCHYSLDAYGGEFKNIKFTKKDPENFFSLKNENLFDHNESLNVKHTVNKDEKDESKLYDLYLKEADDYMKEIKPIEEDKILFTKLNDNTLLVDNKQIEAIRWWIEPFEANSILKNPKYVLNPKNRNIIINPRCPCLDIPDPNCASCSIHHDENGITINH